MLPVAALNDQDLLLQNHQCSEPSMQLARLQHGMQSGTLNGSSTAEAVDGMANMPESILLHFYMQWCLCLYGGIQCSVEHSKNVPADVKFVYKLLPALCSGT